MRLLLVEDSLELAEWLAKVLRADGYAVDVARDGEEADDLLRLATFDLVILDLALPRLDGLGVLRRLRGRNNPVPVILLTANASLNGRVKGLDEGADDYLVKPFEVRRARGTHPGAAATGQRPADASPQLRRPPARHRQPSLHARRQAPDSHAA